jgi:hypothetical protein
MGCAALGIAYSDGVGVEKDLQKSEDLYRHACDDDYAPACVLAGDVYENIKRGKKTENLTTALTFYDRACAIDHNFGCYEYAELHQSGKPAESSDNKAAEYFQKTCTIDPTRGCYEAAQLMEDGRVKASPTEIEALYNNACEHGNTAACDKRMIP